ncbi:MAG: hypothetical protein ACREOC_15185 [Gemmatimonadales bacterium]
MNLPAVRFSPHRPGEHFYTWALRLEELLAHAVLPLRNERRLDLTFDAAEETATSYRPEQWRYDDADVILLEGILLFKPGQVARLSARLSSRGVAAPAPEGSESR